MNIFRYFLNLYKERRQISLLNWLYGLITLVTFMIAGVLALINQSLGVAILIVPLVAICAMAANILSWALIKLSLDSFNDKFDLSEKAEKPEQKESTNRSRGRRPGKKTVK